MRIDKVLNDKDFPLGKLIQRARALATMTERIQQLLPESLKHACSVATYEEGTLVIKVNSAAFLTPLRYRQTELLQGLRRDPLWCALRNIQFKIASPLNHDI